MKNENKDLEMIRYQLIDAIEKVKNYYIIKNNLHS